jgi:hypothetical protein
MRHADDLFIPFVSGAGMFGDFVGGTNPNRGAQDRGTSLPLPVIQLFYSHPGGSDFST